VINQKVVAGLLSESGVELTIANDGQEALDILEKNSDFHMVLMDAHMPNVDGFEATKAIRANPKYEHIVVVALSGDTAADDIRKMKEAGMEEQLEKPLRMDDFYNVLYGYTKPVITQSYDEQNETTVPVNAVMTKELNGEKGLEVCGGDESFYKDILTEFTTTYSNTVLQLQGLLEQENIKKADKLLLDFIGICANIGADNVRSIALELKHAIKNNQQKDYFRLFDDLDFHLSILLKDIESYNK
jgi:CheY-like chemotaxis protein